MKNNKRILAAKRARFSASARKYGQQVIKANELISKLRTKIHNLEIHRDVAADSYRIALQRVAELETLLQ